MKCWRIMTFRWKNGWWKTTRPARQVQYGETDFDFIQRLMQEWGIYWWFEHSENSHTLVLADAIGAHKACPDSPLVEWHREGLKLDKSLSTPLRPVSDCAPGSGY